MRETAKSQEAAIQTTFIVESSPHLRAKDTTPRIMYRVILSLVPAVVASLYFFRWRAAALILVSLVGALATEALFLLARKKPLAALLDGSAAITGLLLALTLPPSLPLVMALIGSIIAISLGKQIYGGLGHNIFNPALVGRAFLQAAFPVAMTTWVPPVMLKVDLATFATPLGNLKFQNALAQGTLTPIKELFWGNVGGCLGETSAAALLLGAIYLLVKKSIDWRIPTGIIASLCLFTGIFWLANPQHYAPPHFHLFAGGLVLGAFFMATDMVTSPITPAGIWIYSVGIGTIIGIIRLFGGLPEGVMYSILLMNTFVPLFNIYLRPRILGERRPKK
ncbi:MAG: RnfABCDGE type electron transport complex subunit D [Candidatus Aminicenantales bacterium]